MRLDKSMILDLLRQHGDQQTVDQANRELPDQVDTNQHAGLLKLFGLSLEDLRARLPRGLPDL